jgi:hypothetical protein
MLLVYQFKNYMSDCSDPLIMPDCKNAPLSSTMGRSDTSIDIGSRTPTSREKSIVSANTRREAFSSIRDANLDCFCETFYSFSIIRLYFLFAAPVVSLNLPSMKY